MDEMLRTELKELPPLEGRSKYDALLQELDGNVVVLLRGEDFDEARTTNAVRSDLAHWAKNRGVKVSARVSWTHPESGEPSPFERDGKQLPWGFYVKVSSKNEGSSGRPRASRPRRKTRPKKRA